VFDLLKFIEANAENVKPLNGKIVHLTGAEMSAIMGKITISVEPNSQEMRDKISGTKEAYENFIRAGLHDECSCDECCEVF
jgi:metal-responsive CopG/Arc/MetJ family transcriptional regulator